MEKENIGNVSIFCCDKKTEQNEKLDLLDPQRLNVFFYLEL